MKKKTYRSFENARKFARSLKLESRTYWIKYCESGKLPKDIPRNGDGVYRSEDAGKSWENMGLKKSEHLSKIIIHPKNSNIIWVASQGPLWSKGGERGIYKSTDGGESWTQTLGDNEWVGATDLLIDPRDPNVL